MRAVIIGASGLIGTALFDTFRQRGVDVVGTKNKRSDHPELLQFDMLTDDILTKIDDIDEDDVVYVLSAYSNPSWIFDHQQMAKELNYVRTVALIEAVKSRNPRIIFMSSVEVFDGVKGEYREDDAANPLNYYGYLKEQIETYLAASYENHTVVRTGWNVGWDLASRCVVRLTYETLIKGGARMARDNEFSIVDVKDTATCLAALVAVPKLRKIHICSDEKVNRARLARRIIDKSRNGHKMAYREVDFAEIEYTEKRGRVNDLVNELSKSCLGMKYRRSEDIIDSKTALIDQNFDEINR